jgi:[ribosomal protein S5]-alanine N-acetyltransferase
VDHVTLVPISTDRTTLRPVLQSDIDAIHAILGDERTTAAVSWGQPDRESTARWIERRMSQEATFGLSMWAVEHRESGDVVGLCGFFPRELPEVELGYVIRFDSWGKGLATEVVAASIDAAINASYNIVATIRSTNARSLAVARRVGLGESDRLDDDRGQLVVFRSNGPANLTNSPIR